MTLRSQKQWYEWLRKHQAHLTLPSKQHKCNTNLEFVRTMQAHRSKHFCSSSVFTPEPSVSNQLCITLPISYIFNKTNAKVLKKAKSSILNWHSPCSSHHCDLKIINYFLCTFMWVNKQKLLFEEYKNLMCFVVG